MHQGCRKHSDQSGHGLTTVFGDLFVDVINTLHAYAQLLE